VSTTVIIKVFSKDMFVVCRTYLLYDTFSKESDKYFIFAYTVANSRTEHRSLLFSQDSNWITNNEI